MELHEFSVKSEHRETISICPTGDWHLGSAACNEDKLKHFLDWVKSRPRTYLILCGDLIEGINIQDSKRFDPDMVARDMRDHLSRLAQVQTETTTPAGKPTRI